MIEEKREILRMLSEGTIDVEGAERLLAALEKGGQKRRGMKSRPEHGRTTGASTIAEAMNTIRETVAGIGSAVREAMESGESGEFDPDEEEICSCGEELALSEGSFPVGKDSIVRVTHPRGKAPGSLSPGVGHSDDGILPDGEGTLGEGQLFAAGTDLFFVGIELPGLPGLHRLTHRRAYSRNRLADRVHRLGDRGRARRPSMLRPRLHAAPLLSALLKRRQEPFCSFDVDRALGEHPQYFSLLFDHSSISR